MSDPPPLLKNDATSNVFATREYADRWLKKQEKQEKQEKQKKHKLVAVRDAELIENLVEIENLENLENLVESGELANTKYILVNINTYISLYNNICIKNNHYICRL